MLELPTTGKVANFLTGDRAKNKIRIHGSTVFLNNLDILLVFYLLFYVAV
jgi:hypothetical protein